MPTTASTCGSHTGVPLKPGSTAKPVSFVGLWLLWRVIGKTKGTSHDVGAGEEVPFAHQEACADYVAIRRVDTYE
jgi:hypothetical protein